VFGIDKDHISVATLEQGGWEIKDAIVKKRFPEESACSMVEV
jgi:hypothetical protein